jgi:hypothetical protein
MLTAIPLDAPAAHETCRFHGDLQTPKACDHERFYVDYSCHVVRGARWFEASTFCLHASTSETAGEPVPANGPLQTEADKMSVQA